MLLYAITIFVSAFLLFQVQPLIAKIILPWFGGAAAVWTTCMLFFQLLLLGGYGYSHWLVRRFPAPTQARLHTGLLILSLFALPILPAETWKPADPGSPAFRILALLAATVGLPYLMLSTTGPLLQAWFARDSRTAGASPYRLYALSNAGSMLALLTYPFAIEPVIATRIQAIGWSAFYAAFVVLCATVAIRGSKSSAAPLTGEETGPAPSIPRMVVWVGLTACASAFLLSITNHLSQNIASIPFLWILPLSLYLLSFILVFNSERWYQRHIFLYAFAVAMGTMAYGVSAESGNLPVQVGLPIFATGLFIACMVCHGELVRLKPAAGYLTLFYVCCALGGALGGVFVGIIAPAIFTGYYELPVTISAATTLLILVLRRDRSLPFNEHGWTFEWLLISTLALGLNVFLVLQIGESAGGAKFAIRNFYGGLRVDEEDEGEGLKRKLTHGTINHGEQYLDQARRSLPVTYYGFDSGVGRTLLHINRLNPLHVGVIGLGTGTLATYGRTGDRYRFYEINPIVVDIAKGYFFYLSDSKAKVDVVLGDARLSLEREPPQNFDVLAVDAFSSDSIPVHLLTREAFGVYFRHLKSDGILAVHVSNRYLDLKPVVLKLAELHGKDVRVVDTDDDPSDDAIFGATWMLVTSDVGFFARPAVKSVAEKFDPSTKVPTWTDDFSNLYGILK